MVSICEDFASEKKLKFSTNSDLNKSKTKCIIFSRVKHYRQNVAPIMLNDNPLPWVDKVLHLGNTLDYLNDMKMDCVIKRGKFIGKTNSLLQELNCASPSIRMKLLSIYTTSFYGSCLWDLHSSEVNRLYSSWNIIVRNVYSLPWTSH